MPWRHRLHWPQPAWISTLTRSPISNSSTSGPSAATVPIYSWPGVKFLLKGRPPPILAGEPLWMTSRSVAQIATASMRTRTSARPGTGVGFSPRESWSGSPSTQAFICEGTGKLGDVLTPDGSYMAAVLVVSGLYLTLPGGEIASPRLFGGELEDFERVGIRTARCFG